LALIARLVARRRISRAVSLTPQFASSQTVHAQKESGKMNTLKNFVKNEQGLETVEYAIITGLIVAGVILTIAAIGVWVKGKFDGLKTDLGA